MELSIAENIAAWLLAWCEGGLLVWFVKLFPFTGNSIIVTVTQSRRTHSRVINYEAVVQ